MVTLFDANGNIVDYSFGNNPELVTMNNSAAGAGSHGGTVLCFNNAIKRLC